MIYWDAGRCELDGPGRSGGEGEAFYRDWERLGVERYRWNEMGMVPWDVRRGEVG